MSYIFCQFLQHPILSCDNIGEELEAVCGQEVRDSDHARVWSARALPHCHNQEHILL